MNKYSSQFGSGVTNPYSYYHDEDESSFQLVDTARVQRPIYQRGRVRFNQQNKLRKEREKRQLAQANMQVLSKTQKSRAYSWDIIVQKVGKKLFFDKRDDSEFDLLTVSETATEPPQEEGANLNSPKNLALEATFINHNFSQQVLKIGEDRYDMEHPNPFAQEEETGDIASVAYRYRKWDLGNGIELICRCEHDAATYGPNNELQMMNIKSLNEWDSRFSGGVDWRSKLDSQRGAVLATELKNNSCKIAKWTACSILAGSDIIKFGYVSRAVFKDSAKHSILGVQQFKPNEFAQQINLNMDNAWGIMRCIIDICMRQKEGKFLIMKDPNKPVIRLYDIPNSTFESSEESDDETSSSEDEDEVEDEEVVVEEEAIVEAVEEA